MVKYKECGIQNWKTCVHVGERQETLGRSLSISEPQFLFLENVVSWSQGVTSYNRMFQKCFVSYKVLYKSECEGVGLLVGSESEIHH